jgi:hypothetical protein
MDTWKYSEDELEGMVKGLREAKLKSKAGARLKVELISALERRTESRSREAREALMEWVKNGRRAPR